MAHFDNQQSAKYWNKIFMKFQGYFSLPFDISDQALHLKICDTKSCQK